MANFDIVEGGIYLFVKKSEFKRTKHVEVIDILKDGTIEVEFGVYKDNDFTPQPVKDERGAEARRATVGSDALVERVDLDEGDIMNQEDERTVVPTDDEGNEIVDGDGADKGGKKPKLTAKERAAAILQAEADREKAKKDKADKLAKEMATKRSEKLKTAGADVPSINEAEVSAKVSNNEFTKYSQLSKEQCAEAFSLIKEAKASYQKASKNAEKLVALCEKAGLVEAEVASEYSNERVNAFIDLTDEETAAAVEGLRKKAAEKKKEDALALRTTLTAEEETERTKLEKVVFKHISTFQTAAFQIGGALAGISQKRLYRNTHASFADYVQDVFGLSRPHAYSVMNAAETFAALTEGEMVDSKSLPSITAADSITAGVRGLLKEQNLQDDPEVAAITRQLARNAYSVAVQNAPKDRDGNPVLSPDHIASTFKVLNEIAKSGTVDVDGKSMPVNLAALSIDEMITTESKERIERMKQSLIERIEGAKTAAKEQRAARMEGAVNDAVKGNGQAIPADVVPRLNTVCTVHGRVALEESSDNDVRLGCNCVFVSTPEGYVFDKVASAKALAKSA